MADVFKPQAPNILGFAGAIENIRGARQQRGLQREQFEFGKRQFAAQEQQKQEQAIAAQKQAQFDQASTLLKNAPTSEIAVRAARIMGDTLGVQIDEEKLIENIKSVQKGVGEILKLSTAGKKQDALNLSIALLNQFSTTKGAEQIRGTQKGLLKDIGAGQERERISGIFGGAEEPTPFIPGQMEEGISITEPEGLVPGTSPTGLPTFGEPTAQQPKGLSAIEQQIEKSFGALALKALQAGDVALFEKLKIAPKDPVIRDVNIGGGKVQTQGVDPATGETIFTIGKKFPKSKAAKGIPFKEGQKTWVKVEIDPATNKPSLTDFTLVGTIDGKVSKAKERTLKKQGFSPESVASKKLGVTVNAFQALLQQLAGTAGETEAVPKTPSGAISFEKFFEREQKKNSALTKPDAMAEYIRQIEAAR